MSKKDSAFKELQRLREKPINHTRPSTEDLERENTLWEQRYRQGLILNKEDRIRWNKVRARLGMKPFDPGSGNLATIGSRFAEELQSFSEESDIMATLPEPPTVAEMPSTPKRLDRPPRPQRANALSVEETIEQQLERLNRRGIPGLNTPQIRTACARVLRAAQRSSESNPGAYVVGLEEEGTWDYEPDSKASSPNSMKLAKVESGKIEFLV